MTSTVEQVKARLGIVEVVSGYLKLERAGANFRARCPFHQEKTPSFFVSPGRGTFHCFGCNRGGDLITFVQEIENLDFLGTLKMLAERAGIPYQTPNRELASLKDRLYLVHEAATNYYREQLAAEPAVLNYLRQRGLTADSIKSFRLGYAPASWRNIGFALARQGFKETELIAAGLLAVSSQSGAGRGAYDRFRGRIMFPLFDTVGRVVGFTGRIFDSAPAQGGSALGGKYLNSPDTALYDKSKLLYLYDRARMAMRTADRAVLVEGQVDALLSHQTDVTETVAVSGTALSQDHLTLIKRLTNNLIMAFDADLAGVNAGKRAIELALGLGFEVKIAVLPPDRDPADLIQTDPAGWRQAVNQAVHIIDFLLSILTGRQLAKRELAHAIEREVYPFIARLANPLDQSFFVNQIAILLGLPEKVIMDGVARIKTATKEVAPSNNDSPTKIKMAPSISRRERFEETIFGLIFWREEFKVPTIARLGETKFRTLAAMFEPRRNELALVAETAYGRSDTLTAELNDLLNYWQKEVWREELAELMILIKQQSTAPPEVTTPLLTRCQELSAKINQTPKNE